MSKWPVENPPPDEHQHVNLRGALADAPVFDGPLNLLIELDGTASAANQLTTTKRAYDDLHPVPVPPAPAAPSAMPMGPPISAGAPVSYDRPHVIVRKTPPRYRRPIIHPPE